MSSWAGRNTTWAGRNSNGCAVTSENFLECFQVFQSRCSHGIGMLAAACCTADCVGTGVGYDSPDKIPDDAIAGSSARSYSAAPSVARHGQPGLIWIPKTNFQSEFVEYWLGEPRLITGMQLQGAPVSGCLPAGIPQGPLASVCNLAPSPLMGMRLQLLVLLSVNIWL